MARKKNDIENKARILKKAQEYFTSYGYSKTNIADIINDLGMSRKTLYDCFKAGKKSILEEIVQTEKDEILQIVDQTIEDKSKNFIDKFHTILTLFFNSFIRNGTLLFDLNKNFPELFESIQNFNKKNILDKVVVLFQQGQKEGKIRKDINLSFIVNFLGQAIQNKSFFDLLNEHPITWAEANRTIISIAIKGLEVRENDACMKINE